MSDADYRAYEQNLPGYETYECPDCRRSYEISFRGLDGMTPAGMGKATGASTGLPGGNPLQKKKEAEY